MSETAVLDARLNHIDRQFARYRRIILWAMVIGVIVNGALFLRLAGPERPGQTLMELTLVDGWTAPTVCPGETVDIDYTVHIRASGVFSMDRSLWRVSPPLTLIFSTTETGVYPTAIDFISRREWAVPVTYISPIDGKAARLTPGDYEWRWAMSTTSRSTVPSILVVPFRVKEDCE